MKLLRLIAMLLLLYSSVAAQTAQAETGIGSGTGPVTHQSGPATAVPVPVPSPLLAGGGAPPELALPAANTPVNFGTFPPPAVKIVPWTIPFGPITNNNPVTVQIVVTLTSNPSGAYSITSSAGTNNVVAGASITPAVTFTNAGQSAGTKTGQLRIQWFYNGNPISGGDYYYDLSAYVANMPALGGLSFNVQTYLNEPKSDSARLTNNGTLPLSVTAKTLTGSGAARFQLVAGSAEITIPAHSSQDIPITYLGDVHGTQTAYLNFGYTYDGITYSASDHLQVQGTTVYKPNVAGNGTTFGTSVLGAPVDGMVSLQNNGSVNLTITGIGLTGTNPELFQITGGGQTGDIAPGQGRSIAVRYLAGSVGSHTAKLRVTYSYDGVPSNILDLGLSGQTIFPPQPTVTTSPISGVTDTAASGGGTIISSGNAPVTGRGVCWSSSSNPTIADSHTVDGAGSGSFTSSLTGLNPATTYHVRAYATNSIGTGYGSDLTFTSNALLTLMLQGSGNGIVHSDPPDITCTGGTCTQSYPFGADIVLTPAAIGHSLFNGWSGDCTTTLGPCTLAMGGNRVVLAEFAINPNEAVRVEPGLAYYKTVGGAYRDLPTGGATIKACHLDFPGNLTFDLDRSFSLIGGYTSDYSRKDGSTGIIGTVTVSSGRVTLENILIK